MALAEAEQALREAQDAFEAITERFRTGKPVEPLDYARAEGEVKIAEGRVHAARQAETEAIEQARLDRIAELREAWVETFDTTEKVAAEFHSAVTHLTAAVAAARQRDDRLREILSELGTLGDLAEGEIVRLRRGTSITPTTGTIAGRQWTDLDRPPALAADAAHTAVGTVYATGLTVNARQVLDGTRALARQRDGKGRPHRPSDSYEPSHTEDR